MKRIVLSVLIFVMGGALYAQSPEHPLVPTEMVDYYKSLGKTFANPGQLFTKGELPTQKASQVANALKKGSILELNAALRSNIQQNAPDFMTLSLPLSSSETLDLELVKVDIFAEGFFVNTDQKPSGVDIDLGVHYRGVIKGKSGSIASVSVFKDKVMGLFSSKESGNLVLGPLDGNQAENFHVLYNDADLIPDPDFSCETPDDGMAYDEEQLAPRPFTRANECIKVYIEVDDDIRADKGGVTGATNYVTGLFNQSATIYAAENLNYQISQVFVWAGTSPYTGGSSGSMLNQFKSQISTLNGDLGHMVSYKSSGGIAAGFAGLCNSNVDNSLCFSDIFSTYSTVPTYSWSVMVFTHEMGHLNGSRHTHACVWNGNNTAIDGCAGYIEGSCALPGYPSGGGTMMSYCHLSGRPGIVFSLGFGTQPGNVIRNAAAGASCLSCDGPAPCFEVNSYPYSESFESGTGGWSNTGGDDLDWLRDANGTPSSGTGPSTGADGSWYMYVEASSPNYPSKVTYLNGPCFDLSGQTNASFTFSYHMNGTAMGTLQFQTSTNGGASWGTQWANSVSQGDAWQTQTISLNTWLGQSVQVRFVGTTGSSWSSDIAIDDIEVTTGTPPPGCTGPSFSEHLANFESGFDNWVNESGDDLDWARRTGGTPSSNTGPSGAFVNSYYIYCEASFPNYPNKVTRITSPCLQINNAASAFVDFGYHLYGSSMGSLQLQASSNNGLTWGTIWSVGSNQGNSWQSTTRSLTSFVGQTIKLRFVATTGSSWSSDIAVDGIQVNAFYYLPEGETDIERLDAKVYPIPAQDKLNVELSSPGSGTVKMRVLDLSGRAVHIQLDGATPGTNYLAIGLDHIPAGSYLLEIQAGEEQIIKKFVKTQ